MNAILRQAAPSYVKLTSCNFDKWKFGLKGDAPTPVPFYTFHLTKTKTNRDLLYTRFLKNQNFLRETSIFQDDAPSAMHSAKHRHRKPESSQVMVSDISIVAHFSNFIQRTHSGVEKFTLSGLKSLLFSPCLKDCVSQTWLNIRLLTQGSPLSSF